MEAGVAMNLLMDADSETADIQARVRAVHSAGHSLVETGVPAIPEGTLIFIVSRQLFVMRAKQNFQLFNYFNRFSALHDVLCHQI